MTEQIVEKKNFEFQTDVKQLLDLVTHSLYSHKDIFLRELISNASDAIEKVRFDSLTNSSLLEDNSEWKVKIIPDDKAKTLTISDNGCGMTKEDLISHIGTIARSGTQEFLEKLKEASGKNNPDLIGQFGLGFYSSFMVADKVTIQTRAAGGSGYQWISSGEGSYEINDHPKPTRGTDIILHLKEDCHDFLKEYTIRDIVKKYSDYVEFPICMDVEKQEYPLDKDGKPDYQAKPVKKVEEEAFNSSEAIWLKNKTDIKAEDYNNFYKQISHDFSNPLETIHYSAEGAMEYKALMYIPSKAPLDLFSRDSIKGLHLYINRIFIMNDCKKMLPEYLRFIKGVVDSADLPLNVSRELLQDNPQLTKINKGLVSKIFSTLKKIQTKKRDEYLTFYKEFGKVLKEGLYYEPENKDKIADLLLFETTKTGEGEYKSLKEYIDGMQKGQKDIFYIVSENRNKALSSPHLEIFTSKDIEVILMTDVVDEWVLPQLTEYDKKKLTVVQKGSDSLEDNKTAKREIKKQSRKYADLLKAIKEKLDQDIQEVKLSGKLQKSACCLSDEEGATTPQMLQMFKSLGKEAPAQKKILELNPSHPLIETLNKIYEKDKESTLFNDYVTLIYEQALLTEGSQLKDSLAFAIKVSELMVKAAAIS